ncbi:hypothetical protein VI08_17310 [Luteibacter yeojuensis]|uniref:Uncharacterized protein n=1 Tax=Luteibacter yeojuensis TaxID=345309 RepID=A0A0F3K8Y4_9GAMM|nr:hypothetical protein VI08_17310 [Luteibacter yeojuensis]
MRSLAVLAATGALLAAAGPAVAETSSRLAGPFVLRSPAGTYLGIAADGTLEAHAVARPGSAPRFLWPADELERLLSHGVADVTLPAEGYEGTIVNQRGECLSIDPVASSPAWLPCGPTWQGQVWEHDDGALYNKGASLGYTEFFSRRGTLSRAKGDAEYHVVTALLKPLPAESAP